MYISAPTDEMINIKKNLEHPFYQRQ